MASSNKKTPRVLVIYNTPEGAVEQLLRMHRKESPFVLVFSTADRCERVREVLRDRLGHDIVSAGHFHQRSADDSSDTEWIVATPGEIRPGAFGSCAVEDGTLANALCWRNEKLPCVAFLHVYWQYSSAALPPETTTTKIWRRTRKCTWWGGVIFLLLFLVAWIFGP
jgi:hypothetical protein